jgi:broad specificity phosphatase PhoE
LHLIRHGSVVQPTSDDGAICYGWTDLPLADAGRADMHALAAASPPVRAVPMWSSDLSRARDSATLLLAEWGRDADELQVDARLREVHFGAFEGRAWRAVERDDAPAFTEWMAGWETAAPPGGESFPSLIARVDDWWCDVQRNATDTAAPPHEWIVVTHAGVVRAALCVFAGLTPAAAFTLTLRCGHVTTLRFGAPGDRAVIERLDQPRLI